MRNIRTYAQATEPEGAELLEQVEAQFDRLHARLAGVKHIVVVASGKGGVGKSFIAAHLAAGLAGRGLSVGALDADINGPSLALMLDASRAPLQVDPDGVQPAPGRNGCRVMSTDLLLAAPDAPVRWKEPAMGAFIWQSTLETGALREFLSDVKWGELDALVIDLPPGTDKIARILSLLPRVSALLLVLTPSQVTNAVVMRSLTQVQDAGVDHIGLITNQATYICPACGTESPLFGPSVPESRISSPDPRSPILDPRIWASIPFDPAAAAATDRGAALPADSAVATAVDGLVDRVEGLLTSLAEARV